MRPQPHTQNNVVPFSTHGPNLNLSMNTETMRADDEWSSFVLERANIRPLITNFRKGYAESEKFERIHAEFNAKWADADGWWGITLW